MPIVPDSEKFPEWQNSSLKSKPCASDGSTDGSFQGEEIFAQENQLVTFDENNRVGVAGNRRQRAEIGGFVVARVGDWRPRKLPGPILLDGAILKSDDPVCYVERNDHLFNDR